MAGSDELAQRMLKAWIVWGEVAANKDEHRGMWSRVQDARTNNTLPCLTDLHRSLRGESSCLPGPPIQLPEGNSVAASGSAEPEPKRRCVGVAAERGGSVDAIESQLLQMMQEGILPTARARQRARQQLTDTTRYRVPEALLEALRRGLINPNLPPPLGMLWEPRPGNAWALAPQGG